WRSPRHDHARHQRGASPADGRAGLRSQLARSSPRVRSHARRSNERRVDLAHAAPDDRRGARPGSRRRAAATFRPFSHVNEERKEGGVLLEVAYDGTDFHGGAAQKSGARTVEETLFGALRAMDPRASSLRGASRTDAGVHAEGQLAAFDTTREIPAR